MQVNLQAERPWLLAVMAAGLVIGAWFLPSLLQIILLIFAGILFGNFLTNLTVRLAGMTGLRYGVAYSLVIAALLLLFVGTVYYMGSRIVGQITALTDQLSRAGSQVSSQYKLQNWWEQVRQLAPQGQPAWASDQAVSTATSAAWITISAIGGIFIIAFLGFYFALQPERYRKVFVALIRPTVREQANRLLDRAGTRLWRWVIGRLVGMLVIGVCTGFGLWWLNIPLPITLAVLAGAMNFVPNIGPIIAGLPAVLLALQQGTNVALYVLIFYFLLQFLESYFLTPLIDQHQVSIPPGLILSAQLVFGVIAGFLGLLLATPLIVLITIVVDEVYVKKHRE